jgi:hypothetical protein
MNLKYRIHTKAIVTGVAVELGVALLLGPLEALILFGQSLSGVPLHIVSLFIGFLSMLFAAYLTARNSPTDKFVNVLMLWAILILRILPSMRNRSAPASPGMLPTSTMSRGR